MAVEGNLQTMSMASLVQAICLEERNASLSIKRNGVEGVIFFDRGEIAHATLGSLVGADAVYELVTWTEGSFFVRDNTVLPRRTIESSWSSLLMEGLRRTDEQQAETLFQTCIKKALSPAEMQHDRVLENDLIVMLSKLEYSRANLISEKKRGRLDQLTPSLCRMIEDVNDFARSLSISEPSEDTSADVDQKMDDIADVNLQPTDLPSNISKQLVLDKSSCDQAREKLEPSEFAERVIITLEGYFSFFSKKFVSSLVADRWIEASTVFLEDLTKTIQDIQF